MKTPPSITTKHIIQFAGICIWAATLVVSCNENDSDDTGADWTPPPVEIHFSSNTGELFVGATVVGIENTDDFSLVVEGQKIIGQQAGEALFTYDGFFSKNLAIGDSVSVVATHAVHGEVTFTMVRPGSPEEVVFTPPLESWLENVLDNDNTNDGLTARWEDAPEANGGWMITGAPMDQGCTVSRIKDTGNSLFLSNTEETEFWEDAKQCIQDSGKANVTVTITYDAQVEWPDGEPLISEYLGGQFIYPLDSEQSGDDDDDDNESGEVYCDCSCTCQDCVADSIGFEFGVSSCNDICPDVCSDGGEMCGLYQGESSGSCKPI